MLLANSRPFRNGCIATLALTLIFLYVSPSTRTYIPAYLKTPSSSSSLSADDYPSDYKYAPDSLTSSFAQLDLSHEDHKVLSERNLRDLIACLARGDCGQNQDRVVLVTGQWFRDSLVSRRMSPGSLCLLRITRRSLRDACGDCWMVSSRLRLYI
jgi:hypothetical protein